MPKFKCTNAIDTHVQVEVEAKDEDEAREKAVQAITVMDDTEYNSQLINNAEGGETSVEKIP